ncbi:2-polyprenyl-6-hydroxyphenyl methylase / 3-demethylubiquinone-9 3-methyltransferase [Roseivivax halotolerans]|uniref:2-polyprenyl-6-hydroxyphenyl methylase / 3-demethylubiquinone-9 3-methyltransferase n=1 Tax=Roseivivax halotolerans TaxID=93684 RepID=A0A1I5XVY2_9RHOB|nr:bifunctional 2-polyprenyl-6-hydroxyphenol methylase/3-demethylubiquinol 3-O-methyltransferase UbiG [Roseivivax halotolerans]SFQ36109.1 2-polyprenyl-6-hydroxyphenyl methylase / 3-demethylubiquinone-9 3-methyltransferase [Roseivivax halotolerans]
MSEQKRNNLAIYDDVAAKWWSDEIRWVRTLKNLVPARMRYFDRFASWDGAKVLDLGCAGGFMAEALARRGAHVTGLDPAEDAIAAARAHADEEGLAITYDIGTGEGMSYPDAAFDAVVCVDVLEHVADLQKTLDQVVRVLKPGGRFFFDTINRNRIARLAAITIAEDVVRILPKGTHDPEMFIRPEDLRAGFAAAGLTDLDMTGLGPRGISLRGDLTFGALPLKTVQYMGVAEKPA